MDAKNSLEIKKQLFQLGFPESVESQLRYHALLGSEQFELLYRQERGVNRFTVVVHIHRKADGYRCSWYEATLSRLPEIPKEIVGGVTLWPLAERMHSINWAELAIFGKGLGLNESAAAMLEVAEEVVQELEKLKETEEGARWAAVLRFKFWKDTPLDGRIPGLGALRSAYELAQRFYFLDGEEPITLEECYRFLCHKWRERELKWAKKGAIQAGNAKPSKARKPKKGSLGKRKEPLIDSGV